MDFIKRHYEKIILLGLFVIFIGLMLMVQSVINSTRSVTDEHLALPKRQANFVNEDPAEEKFDTARLRENSRLKWFDKELRGDNYAQSDFVRIVRMKKAGNIR